MREAAAVTAQFAVVAYGRAHKGTDDGDNPLGVTAGANRGAYRADIDGLRAVSVLAVVGFHAFPRWVPGGFIGVDVFFVISGYLISGIILGDAASGRFSLRNFYARRARRLLAALIPVLLACLVAGWLLMTAPEFEQLGKHVAAAATFTSNFVLWREAGYFDSTAALKPLLHLWSLGIEEQFYIVWPLALLLLVKGRIRVRSAIAMLGAASFALSMYMLRTDPAAAFFLPAPRAWELLLGAGIAAAEAGDTARETGAWLPRPAAHAMAAAGLITILISALTLPADEFPGWWALAPTLGAASIIVAGPAAWTNRHALATPTVVGLGVISYPIYLWHWPLLSFAQVAAGEMPTRTVRIAAVLATLPLAWLTHEYVEKRAHVRRASGARPPVLFAAPMLMALLVGVGFVGLAAYLGVRFSTPIADSAITADNRWPEQHAPSYRSDSLARQLFSGGFDSERDFFIRPAANAGVWETAFLGDSHAFAFFVAVRGDDSASALLDIGRGTCLPLLGVESYLSGSSMRCQPLMDRAITWAAAAPAVHTVVLAGFFTEYLDGRVQLRPTATRTSPPLPSDTIDFGDALARTVGYLEQRGKQVVVMLDVPEMGFRVSECLSRRVMLRTFRGDCSVSYEAHQRESRLARAAVERVAARLPRMKTIDPSVVLCDGQRCTARMGNELLYRNDGNHLNMSGARRVGVMLRKALANLSGTE